jgi:hypothetical protein
MPAGMEPLPPISPSAYATEAGTATPTVVIPVNQQRAQTLAEGEIPSGSLSSTYGSPARPAISTMESPSRPSASKLDGTQAPSRERNRTKFAAFFDAPDEGPFALILMKSGDSAGKTIPVTKTAFTLGANPNNDFSIPGDSTVSGQHAKLFWEGSILKIEDMKSTNGTFVNSSRLAPGRQLLRPGDELRLGQTVMILDRV